ncbi:hypothetical protein [Nitrosomonas ureae]|uniref:Uncharacterized protein n=1 Tax=Nitrosomonas ureae TaxID=44577 RepID=A0A286ACD6_9PROT|nr:hypothetical protein [Nitrosomonas ureae]PTQ85600.1 hypothetical protein C8R28_101374 [Nitrosomonas ureae]SOD19561.1 hypothetical protein SAMN06297164_2569 [Nitrosomonas ureae]
MTQSTPPILKKKYKFENLQFSDNDFDELQEHPDDEESPAGISTIDLTPEEALQKKIVPDDGSHIKNNPVE